MYGGRKDSSLRSECVKNYMSFKGKGKPKFKKEKPEFDQQIVDLARVTRVTKGGKQLSFRALVVIGNRKGKVGYGVDKGKDVQIAVEKAVNQAKKNLINIPILKETIPHRTEGKYKAGKVMIKPAPRGSGIIAGGAVRIVLELGGVPNASAKIMGKTGNKMNNVKATFVALQSFKARPKKKEDNKVAKIENIEKDVVKKENKENLVKVEDKK